MQLTALKNSYTGIDIPVVIILLFPGAVTIFTGQRDLTGKHKIVALRPVVLVYCAPFFLPVATLISAKPNST